MDETQVNEIVADAMATVEAARYDASRRRLEHFGQTKGSAINDWAEILVFTPMSQSAEFASVNGL